MTLLKGMTFDSTTKRTYYGKAFYENEGSQSSLTGAAKYSESLNMKWGEIFYPKTSKHNKRYKNYSFPNYNTNMEDMVCQAMPYICF